jgi:hypothetical protein
VAWLPNIRTQALKAHIEAGQVTDVRQVPDELLNSIQQRVKTQTLSGDAYFDAAQAAAELAQHPLPAFFLDFETISFAVPIWKGTRPYQPLTFQFSVHRIGTGGELEHRDFLDLSGVDPREALAEVLIAACDVAELGLAETQIAEAEGSAVGIQFGEKPGAGGIGREELDDGGVVEGVSVRFVGVALGACIREEALAL